MGVHGLWDLLAPVGRRVSVETLAGKRLAIDASIWMVQFMKAMRDEKGEMVRNAHLLGFFRRICKLLFLRTKPVFVFDGATPALKRRTVVARRRQRENAKAKVRKMAEKLFLNQVKSMRLNNLAENIKDQQNKSSSKGKEVLLDQSDTLEKSDSALECHTQEMVDEMLAASILFEESSGLDGTASPAATPSGNASTSASAAHISNAFASASTSAAAFMSEDEDNEDDEEMILPVTDGNVDPAVLAALPPSMQLDLLVQMRERLMAENRQKYQKVKKAPQKFSELQIEAYLKTVAFRREIDEVQKAASGKGVGGVQTSRIASETNREFIFSSSFSGDKQALVSNGAKKDPEIQQKIGKKDSSSFNVIASATKFNTEAGSPAEEAVETYIDERGRKRIHRRRAMGIRMTRDLQRNIELINELEQERPPPDSEANSQIKLDVKDGPAEKSDWEGQLEPSDGSNCDIVQKSTGKLLLPEIHEDALKSETCIKISFDHDRELRCSDGDDEFFTRLVAGSPVTIFSADNSSSDCEWEDGTIVEQSDSFADGNKLEMKSSLEDAGKNESEVEWEDGPDVVGDKLVTMSFRMDDNQHKETGVEFQRGNVGIHEDQEISADIQKAVSKGSAEEEAALQEAIKRSLGDLTGATTSTVLPDLEKSNYACNRIRSESCSPRLSSEVGGDVDDNELFFAVESDQSNTVTQKDSFAPSSSDMHLRSAFYSTDARADLDIPIDGDVTSENAAMGGSNISIGQAASVVEVQKFYDDKRIITEDDIQSINVPEKGRDVQNSGFNAEGNTDELLGGSVEDELLMLGEEYKTLEEEKRKLERNADSVNSEMFVECQELLQMFGLPYIIAPMEAEAQCAYLELANLVDGVVTDDSDVFLFGAHSVYKNIFDDRKYVETYFMKDIESELGLSREKLICMALLLGSDYTEGVSGIGIVNAIEVVNAFPEEDGLHKFREWVESPDPTILGRVGLQSGSSTKDKGSKASNNGVYNSGCDMEGTSSAACNEMQENEGDESSDSVRKTNQLFMNKHRNVSKNWHIPASFPSDAVISAYKAPQVDKSAEPFAWGKPDIFSLRRLCWEKFAWANKKADELLLPVLKEYNKHETQLRLEAFYTFNERFAKIRSKRIKQAVKGIAAKRSSADADDLQELPENMKKRRASSSNRSDPKKKDHTAGETRNSAKRSKSKKRDLKGGLSSGGGSTGPSTEAEEMPVNDTGGSRMRGRRRGKAVRRGRRKESSDSEVEETSICSPVGSSDEHEHAPQAEKVELPDNVRRSKRARRATNYLEKDEECDELTESLNQK